MRATPLLTMLGLVVLSIAPARPQETWPPPLSEAAQTRIEVEATFREYLRLQAIADETAYWYAYWLKQRGDPLSGKTGDFWRPGEFKQLLGR